MPELPDVEVLKQYLEAASLHQRIEEVWTESDGVLRDISAQQLRKALVGRELVGARRHGKYLFAVLDNGTALVLHFGMSGGLRYGGRGEDHRHTHFRLNFTNGFHLAYTSRRKLGIITVSTDREAFIRERRLGPDALDTRLNFGQCKEILAKSNACIKGRLMDQKVLAGIGNLYADEILFQSGIHPATRARALSAAQLRRLFREIKTVLTQAIQAQAEAERMPAAFLLPQRYRGGRCPKCDAPLRHLKLCGRTAYFCPRCQPAT